MQPVVADGEGVGHLRHVQEVGGVPVRERRRAARPSPDPATVRRHPGGRGGPGRSAPARAGWCPGGEAPPAPAARRALPACAPRCAGGRPGTPSPSHPRRSPPATGRRRPGAGAAGVLPAQPAEEGILGRHGEGLPGARRSGRRSHLWRCPPLGRAQPQLARTNPATAPRAPALAATRGQPRRSAASPLTVARMLCVTACPSIVRCLPGRRVRAPPNGIRLEAGPGAPAHPRDFDPRHTTASGARRGRLGALQAELGELQELCYACAPRRLARGAGDGHQWQGRHDQEGDG